MGENPNNVHCFGSSGLDDIHKLKTLTKKKMYQDLKLTSDKEVIMVTYHPSTVNGESGQKAIGSLLQALDNFNENIIFTSANVDTGGASINNRVRQYVKKNSNAQIFKNLGRVHYFTLMKNAQCMIGNSSSGLCEAPSFKLAVVNLGNRQKGRLQAKNVINVGTSRNNIVQGINKALSSRFRKSLAKVTNPYHKGLVAPKIVKVLIETDLNALKKGQEI